MQSQQKIQQILDFWFGSLNEQEHLAEQKAKAWWVKDPVFDAEIKRQFYDDMLAAQQGKYDDWKNNAQACLALIILLDQFSRNVYRDTPLAFAQDRQALRLAQYAIEQGYDQQLPYIQRVFIYMPLEHSENIVIQNQCIELFTRLAEQVPEYLQEKFNGFLTFALKHQVIIQQFHRFPHRNKILDRKSTEQEIEFLTQPDSSF